MDCECVVKADIERVLAEESRSDGMKRPRPAQRIRHQPGLCAEHLTDDMLNPSLHLGGGAAREGQQHHAAWIEARDDQMRDSVSKGIGLAGACSRDNEEWRSFVERAAAV